MSTAVTQAPYRHNDGSNCWTKDCSRNSTGAPASFAGFLKWAGREDLAAQERATEQELTKRFLPANRIRKGVANFARDESHHAEYERARTTLPKEQWDAVNYYMQYAYQKVNASLRGGLAWRNFVEEDRHEKVDKWAYTDWSEEKLEQDADRLINQLDGAFEHLREMYPAGEQTLYRFETVPAGESLDEMKARYQPGSEVTLPAYTSTSPNANLMISTLNQSWMKDRQMVVFEIVSERGVNLHTAFGSGGGVTAEEQEVLLPRGSRFKVHRVLEAPYHSGYDTRTQEQLGYYGYRDNWKKPILKNRFTVIQLIDITA